MHILDLQEQAYRTSKANGFWEDSTVTFAQKIALIHSELSEALEADRKGLMDDKIPHRDGREVELADAMIRIADLAEAYGFNLENAIREKMAFNSERPRKHGSNY